MVEDTARYADEMFPSDYASWRYCIEDKCGLALTPEFVQARIAVLGDPHHEESRRFASVYGEPWREQVLVWFQRAAAEA
ncbi:MAG: hypothetical protein KUF77_04070 [Candidatus Thiodiazotropha sp. (ex Lucina aurantia)]|uniref:Uncharacterized protein n=2 Tax=Candidatus Thiodiazotropha TaxID=1913444 RepID=A0A7Z1AG07_9GAMM|nr:hypothetical protein [Candidatus Thiodiazotropha endolucinida]MBT3010540.1 hypothetical protein [Candidatus Thiodiazotropha sp. (ex Lucina pensylvanica)]MBT3016188.1 hypothetical protein [Candidatus Thiodiazotropha taylori]MBT3040224.1 hypothetical protein [Candidatus Thiodiazotropha sp. (ex Codakia orbicularis)]MBV2102183.1 hypothetical protein [Candidatus Thiodiazotropha sp. (ex Lucina aurantia)]MBT3022220.1 hypothetical protein [Candidatus Thiodiazotropha taylori]